MNSKEVSDAAEHSEGRRVEQRFLGPGPRLQRVPES